MVPEVVGSSPIILPLQRPERWLSRRSGFLFLPLCTECATFVTNKPEEMTSIPPRKRLFSLADYQQMAKAIAVFSDPEGEDYATHKTAVGSALAGAAALPALAISPAHLF